MFQLTFSRLRKLNLGAAAFQLITGIAILGVSDYDGKQSLPWYTFFISAWARDTAAGPAAFYSPAPKQVANFPLGIWCGSFLLLSGLHHLLITLPRVNGAYNRLLCTNRQPFRWAEYSVSAAIMQVMIAQLCGITDVHLLFALFGLMGACMLFGWQMELLNGERLECYTYDPSADPKQAPPARSTALPFIVHNGDAADGGAGAHDKGPAAGAVDWTPFWFGFYPFCIAMLMTACFFFQAVSRGDPPGFVWAIWFILAALYLLFAVNQWLQFKGVRRWAGFARAEFFYIILSLTSKQLLAWITFGGTMRFKDGY